MNQLINVKIDENQEPVMSARELHEFLETRTAYKDWFPRMAEYGFEEGKDFCSNLSESTGGRPSTDHIIKLDMAKEIAMIQRSEKGKQARQYFLAIEKEWNSPEKVMARALKFASEKINILQIANAQQDQIISELQPKASYYDLILQCKELLSASQIAKDYGKSAKWLNKTLNELGVQYKRSETWLLYQKYAEKGYTQSKTHPFTRSNGTIDSAMQTYWNQKGRLFIYDILKANGMLPVMERELI